MTQRGRVPDEDILRAAFPDQREYARLESPRPGGSVWPHQVCPGFSPNPEGLLPSESCWYCIYADFHRKREPALEVGICCYHEKVCD